LALAEGFVEEDGGSSAAFRDSDVALHGDLDAGVGGVDDFFGEAGAFVADEEGDGLAPVELPGSGGRIAGGRVFVDAGGDGRDGVEFELGEEDAKGGSCYKREMESGARGGAKGFGQRRVGGAELAGGGGGRLRWRPKAAAVRRMVRRCRGLALRRELRLVESMRAWEWAKEIFELCLTGDDQRGYALGMFGVGDAFEEAVVVFRTGKAISGRGDQVSEFFAVALAGVAEEDGFDGAGRIRGLLRLGGDLRRPTLPVSVCRPPRRADAELL